MIAGLCGAVAGLGLVLIVAGFVPHSPRLAARRRTRRVTSRQAVPSVAGLVVGGLVLLTSGWPAAGVGSGVMVAMVVAAVSARDARPKAALVLREKMLVTAHITDTESKAGTCVEVIAARAADPRASEGESLAVLPPVLPF